MNQPVADPRANAGFIERLIVADDRRCDSFSSLGVRQSKHGAFANTGTLTEHALHHLRINVVPADDDQVVYPAHERQKTTRIKLPQVARFEPTARKGFL